MVDVIIDGSTLDTCWSRGLVIAGTQKFDADDDGCDGLESKRMNVKGNIKPLSTAIKAVEAQWLYFTSVVPRATPQIERTKLQPWAKTSFGSSSMASNSVLCVDISY